MFIIKQHAQIRSNEKEVIIQALREDLKPGTIVYEVKNARGKFEGFYQENELSIIPEHITYAQWDNYAKRIERKNLKEHGRSLTFTGIAGRARKFVIEIESDRKMMIVKKGWRDAMAEELPSLHN